MIEIILTEDRSHTLRNTELQETYHSIHGAVQESLHVFIKNGFDYFLDSGKTEISILEVGFGTGLNALLTLHQCKETSTKVLYTALESFPLPESIWSKLNYTSPENDKLFKQLHQGDWNTPFQVVPDFELHKINSSVQEVVMQNENFDIIYFDAFAPDKQPEMWEPFILNKMSASLKPGGIFVTYCAKGQVKRDLKSIGLRVESLQGPPGKREMIRAIKAE